MNKLFRLLAPLDGFAWQRLLKFAASPFFTESERFVVFLRDLHQDRKQDFAQYADGYAALSAQAFRQLLSDTNEFVLLFLRIQHCLDAPQESVFALHNYLLDKGLDDIATKQLAFLRSTNEADAHRNLDFYKNKYDIENALLQQQNRDIRRAEKANLEATVAALDTSFLAERLRLTCDALNRSRILQHEYDIEEATLLVTWARNSRYAALPMVAVYLHILEIVQTQKNDANPTENAAENAFQQLIVLLKNEGKNFATSELRTIYIYPQNYCIRQINGGKEAYNRIFFELMQTMLADNILLNDKGELLPWDYKNIVAAGLRCGDYAWVEDFLQRYNEKLPTGFRKNALNYNLAKLAFAKQNYKKVLKNLQNVEYEDVFYALDSRWTLIKTYYHLDEYDATEAQIDTFRIFLLRHKSLSATLQKQYLQLLRFTKRLLTATTPAKMTQLAADIDAKPQLPDKKWLLAQTGVH
jgi:hypothetical protein